MIRRIKDLCSSSEIAAKKASEPLPALIYSHKSLIRRKLGDVDLQLQENKAVNLKIAAPRVCGIVIRPKETFSFWSLVGKCDREKGYKEGLTITAGKVSKDIGGGMCQFTNLIHWLVLHTPLEISEHHHHDGLDLFPDFGRQVPFGVGTSVFYNYLDYRFVNNTDMSFQLIVCTDDTYLCGEIRADRPLSQKYHILAENEYFSKENGIVYRNGEIYREIIDKRTGKSISKELIKSNHAKVMYDTSAIEIKTH